MKKELDRKKLSLLPHQSERGLRLNVGAFITLCPL